jgi:hypothetical protein
MAVEVNCTRACNPSLTTGFGFEVCFLPKMAEDPVPGHQAFWAKKRASLQSDYHTHIEQYPKAVTQYRQLFKVLCTIEDVAGCTPISVGENAEWTAVVSTVKENRANYCKSISGRTHFSALYGTFTVS